MSDTGSDKLSEIASTDKRLGTPDLEDAANIVLDIAKGITSIAAAGIVASEVISMGNLMDSGSKGLIDGAEGVTARIAELEATMNKAISLIDTTKAGSSTEEADIANALKSAINELEPWRDIANGETMKAKAAKEEVEVLKSEVENLRRELDIANAKVLAAEEQVITRAIESNESSGDLVESLIEPPAATVQSYLCRTMFPTRDDTLSDNSALFNTNRLWPNGQIITYRFTDGHANQQAKVTKVIPEWSRYANITFKLVSNAALLRISFKNVLECWSCIGPDSQKTTINVPYTMALGAVSKLPDTTPGDRALILHQFGHVLGLVHEHMCPGETDAVSLKEGAILKHPSFQDSGPLTSDHLGVYNNSSVTNYVSPDLSSVMIFSMPGDLNEGNFTIEPNVELSPLDKAFMVINYPRTRVHSQAPEWTLRHALLIADVDENTGHAINEELDLTKRRVLFTNYLSRARQQRPSCSRRPLRIVR
ncbi:hypothetical protein BDZ94DRAFT_793309 [Collybia nuda]|uniref:Peptidase metallopeptidase domain-containing protein n=1 Tax=Collybia nuda TaxID=64659 RepID=A0A9P5Y5Y4_9AGAR|nr:hypothetical protein BDZ94DRAFT_793309 [Collybia nuda]